MLAKLKNIFKGDDGIVLSSPIEGIAVAISEVPDPTFGDEILGKGFAVRPTTGRVVAPFDGEVTLVFDTLHAITLTSAQGVEILIHVGLETVGLKGAPFKAHATTGSHVKAGDLLLEFDMAAIRDAGCETICPIVITNTDSYAKIEQTYTGNVKELDAVMKLG